MKINIRHRETNENIFMSRWCVANPITEPLNTSDVLHPHPHPKQKITGMSVKFQTRGVELASSTKAHVPSPNDAQRGVVKNVICKFSPPLLSTPRVVFLSSPHHTSLRHARRLHHLMSPFNVTSSLIFFFIPYFSFRKLFLFPSPFFSKTL